MPVLHFGIDIDKAALTVACHQSPGHIEHVDNTIKAIDAWLKRLPADSVLAVEATGACHRTLIERATRLNRTIFVLNPRDVRHYAESLRRRAKTDRVDAQVIARYVALEQEHLRPYAEPPVAAAQVEHLTRRRALLVQALTRLKLGLSDLNLPTLDTLYGSFKAALADIDRQIDALIAHDLVRARQREQLQSIPGVGPLSSAALLSLFWRLPDITADGLIAFIGFDPRPRESGKYRGERHISKRGDAEFRRLGYLAAQSFARHQVGRPHYEHYRQRGFSATASYVILARKILRIAHALIANGNFFDPQRFATACGRT